MQFDVRNQQSIQLAGSCTQHPGRVIIVESNVNMSLAHCGRQPGSRLHSRSVLRPSPKPIFHGSIRTGDVDLSFWRLLGHCPPPPLRLTNGVGEIPYLLAQLADATTDGAVGGIDYPVVITRSIVAVIGVHMLVLLIQFIRHYTSPYLRQQPGVKWQPLTRLVNVDFRSPKLSITSRFGELR